MIPFSRKGHSPLEATWRRLRSRSTQSVCLKHFGRNHIGRRLQVKKKENVRNQVCEIVAFRADTAYRQMKYIV